MPAAKSCLYVFISGCDKDKDGRGVYKCHIVLLLSWHLEQVISISCVKYYKCVGR